MRTCQQNRWLITGVFGFIAGVALAKILHKKINQRTQQKLLAADAAHLINRKERNSLQTRMTRCFKKGGLHKCHNRALEQDGSALIYAGITENYVRGLIRELRVDTTPYRKLSWTMSRKIRRGQPLSAAISFQLPPAKLLMALPAYPDYDWIIVGKSLVLMYVPTGIVADIFDKVI